jgi:hypothetical protein
LRQLHRGREPGHGQRPPPHGSQGR